MYILQMLQMSQGNSKTLKIIIGMVTQTQPPSSSWIPHRRGAPAPPWCSIPGMTSSVQS